MKNKTFKSATATILALIIVMQIFTLPAKADDTAVHDFFDRPSAYPHSPNINQEGAVLGAPTHGEILWGQIIGCQTGWDGDATAGARGAFTGNTTSFFDPHFETQNCYAGKLLPEPHFLTEVRIRPRTG